MAMNRNLQRAIAVGLLMVMSSVAACDRRSSGADQIAADSESAQTDPSQLTFANISLTQANAAGKTVWEIRAEEAEYSADNRIAMVTRPKGDLFQDDEVIYRVEGDQGEVHQDGEVVYLRGNVIAQDTRDGATLQGDELEWRPNEDLLIVRNNLRGVHPQVNATAQSAQVFTRDRRMELSGNVQATTTDPNFRLKGEQLIWYLPEERIVSPVAVQVERYDNQQIIDRATGNQAEVKLADQVLTLSNNAVVTMQDPPLQISSNNLVWQVETETIASDQPVTVVNRQQQTTLTADRGQMNLADEVAVLNGNVRVAAQTNQSRLAADNLVWVIPTQDLEATGNVVYQQENPVATLRGNRAVGKLEDQTVVVSGGRVVTEVVPE